MDDEPGTLLTARDIANNDGDNQRRSAILNASTNIKKMVSDTAAVEYGMLQECVRETLQQISCAGAPTSMEQTEVVEHLMDKLSNDTIRLMDINSKQTIAIMKDMRRYYIDAIKEIMQMIQSRGAPEQVGRLNVK